MEHYLNKLIDQVLDYNNIPEDIKKQTEWVIADTVVATLYGLKSEKEINNFLKNKAIGNEEKSSKKYPILGTNLKVNVKDNLIIHGTATVANELDEGNTFAKGHPSAHILPALLVSAYDHNCDTEKVIDTYIKAYEISSRLSYAFSMKDDLHPHGTWGNVGGAVARALIEGKTKKEIKDIILLCLSLPLSTSWLAAEKGQTVRNLYTGIGSLLAFESVDLCQYGFNSNMEVVENIWGSLLSEGMDPKKLTDSLLDPPLINKNYIKIHPACRFTHASIDAAKILMYQQDIKPEDIIKITIDTYTLAARCNEKNPSSRLQAKFSIPYAVACTLSDVDMYANYHDNLPKVAGLINVITVNDSPEMTALLPNQRAARVNITLTDGTVLTHKVENARGEYSDRFSENELWKKYELMLERDYSDLFIRKLKNNILHLRNYATFSEWLLANHLIGSGGPKHE